MDDYRAVNRASWDERAPAHAASPDYSIDEFATDPTFLSAAFRFDPTAAERGQRPARRAGRSATSAPTPSPSPASAPDDRLDFSPPPSARRGDRRPARADVDVVESDLDGALDALPACGFDLVHTGVGCCAGRPTSAAGADFVDRWRAGGPP